MAPEYIFDVERRGVESLADRLHLGRRHEQKHRGRIDEAADQPWAGGAVDLRPRPRHPDGSSAPVARGQLCGGYQREFRGLPALEAALKGFRGYVDVAEPGRGAFGEFLAAQANHDGRTSRELTAPVGGRLRIAPDRAWNEPLVG